MDPEYYISMAHLQKDHWWYEARRRIFAHIIKSLHLPAHAKILEAGCGPGANLEMLQQFGEVSGFEPDEFAVNHASQVSGLDIKQGGLPDDCPFEGPFDLVGAFDVIEHIDNDTGAVKALADVTKEGGYLLFSVPAYQWMWSHHDEINHHKRRYTLQRLRKVLEDAGLEVEKISYMNMWLFPLAASVRGLKRLLGKDEESDVTLPSPNVNGMLQNIFASERHLISSMSLPFGLSVIALCRKRSVT